MKFRAGFSLGFFFVSSLLVLFVFAERTASAIDNNHDHVVMCHGPVDYK